MRKELCDHLCATFPDYKVWVDNMGTITLRGSPINRDALVDAISSYFFAQGFTQSEELSSGSMRYHRADRSVIAVSISQWKDNEKYICAITLITAHTMRNLIQP